jgi:hypothetical protein
MRNGSQPVVDHRRDDKQVVTKVKKMDRRVVLGVSAKTLGAFYLIPATTTLLTAHRATAQSFAPGASPAPPESAPFPDPCCDTTTLEFRDSPIVSGWNVSYTNSHCQVVRNEAVPTRTSSSPAAPVSWEVCCGTVFYVTSPDGVRTRISTDCSGQPPEEVIPPWCCCK